VTANIIAGLAVLGTSILGYLQWRLSKRTQDHLREEEDHEETVAMARAMDERINAHFSRLEASMDKANSRIRALETQVGTLSKRLDRAVAYIQENGLPWPPPGEDPTP